MIIVERASDLRAERWLFGYDERQHALYLTGYTLSERRTKRHKMRVTYDWSAYMRPPRPVVPADVKAEALQRFRETLTIRD